MIDGDGAIGPKNDDQMVDQPIEEPVESEITGGDPIQMVRERGEQLPDKGIVFSLDVSHEGDRAKGKVVAYETATCQNDLHRPQSIYADFKRVGEVSFSIWLPSIIDRWYKEKPEELDRVAASQLLDAPDRLDITATSDGGKTYVGKEMAPAGGLLMVIGSELDETTARVIEQSEIDQLPIVISEILNQKLPGFASEDASKLAETIASKIDLKDLHSRFEESDSQLGNRQS
jgi:hypothetical protein